MSIVQAFFAVVSLISCYLAARAALITRDRTGEFLLCAGVSSLAFFVSFPELPLQFAAVSGLVIIVGVILGSKPVAEATSDLGETTMTRNMRNRDAK